MFKFVVRCPSTELYPDANWMSCQACGCELTWVTPIRNQLSSSNLPKCCVRDGIFLHPSFLQALLGRHRSRHKVVWHVSRPR